MFGDMTETKARLLNAIEDITTTVDAGPAPGVEQADLDRLAKDRDTYLYVLHKQLNVPVLELARDAQLPWPAIYRAVDATISEHEKACKNCTKDGGES